MDNWRIVNDEIARSASGGVLINDDNGLFDQFFRQLARIGDACRGEDEPGMGAVKRGDAFQPPDHIGNVRAEDAAVGVHLIQDNIA
jgi:hypothetical protein